MTNIHIGTRPHPQPQPERREPLTQKRWFPKAAAATLLAVTVGVAGLDRGDSHPVDNPVPAAEAPQTGEAPTRTFVAEPGDSLEAFVSREAVDSGHVITSGEHAGLLKTDITDEVAEAIDMNGGSTVIQPDQSVRVPNMPDVSPPPTTNP